MFSGILEGGLNLKGKKFLKNLVAGATLAFGIFSTVNVDAAKPIVLETQGSFAVGGKTVKHAGTFSEENFL